MFFVHFCVKYQTNSLSNTSIDWCFVYTKYLIHVTHDAIYGIKSIRFLVTHKSMCAKMIIAHIDAEIGTKPESSRANFVKTIVGLSFLSQ